MRNKLIVCLLALFSLGCLEALANQQYKLSLNNTDNKSASVTVEECYTLTASVTQEDANNEALQVTLMVENVSEDYFLYLFYDAKTESQLKKFSPRVFYSKRFPGVPKQRVTKTCELQDSHEVLVLKPGAKSIIHTTLTRNGQSEEYTLPFYVAREGKKCLFAGRKMELQECIVTELQIDVTMAPDQRVADLSQAIDKLVDKVNRDTIIVCKHPGVAHYYSEEVQKARYQAGIDSLKRVIFDEVTNRQITKGSILFNKYDALNARLNQIDLSRMTVVEHAYKAPSGCGCPAQYRNLTLEEIYNRLDDIYQSLHNGRTTKDAVKAEVEALKVHSGHINRKDAKSKNYKRGIDKYYNAILNY